MDVKAMNTFEKPPPYSASDSATPLKDGHMGAPAGPFPICISGTPLYGTANVPICSKAGGICPACGYGSLEDDYPCLGIILAFLCMPCCGICCCLSMRERRCNNCNATFR